jgi:hypothetical protein
MVNVTDLANQVKDMVDEIMPDAKKTDAGNRQAGIRVRKAMMEIIDVAKTVRQTVLDLRS